MAGTASPSFNCETIEEYQSDSRIACKYGMKCYQKNPVHLSKYKHPPKASFKKGRKRQKEETVQNGSTKDVNGDQVSDASSGSHSPQRKTAKRDSSSGPEKDVETNPATSRDVMNTFDCESDLPSSPSDMRLNIKQKFLFEMPEDFFSFWDFCQSLNAANPEMAFKDFGFKLVGPYDILPSHFQVDNSKRKQSLFILHWRYYYDPPGFQTVLKGDDKKQFHVGYFRDEPKSMPVFLSSNCAAKDGFFSVVAENIFGTVNAILNDLKKTANPFLQSKIPKVQKSLQEYANEYGFTLETKTQAMKQRDRKIVSKTFNGLGLLVPVEKKTEVGYRELIETDANLKRILNKIVGTDSQEVKDTALDKLQQIITAANIANDECDFGTSVELGLDLFAFGGSEFEQSALQLISTGYSLLGRPEFAKIAQVHICNRKKGVDLDMFATANKS